MARVFLTASIGLIFAVFLFVLPVHTTVTPLDILLLIALLVFCVVLLVLR